MAATSTADTGRDAPETAPAETVQAPTELGALARSLQGERAGLLKQRDEAAKARAATAQEVQATAEKGASEQKPQIEAYKSMAEEFASAARAALPKPPDFPEPPKGDLRGFLMPAQNETPVAAVQRAIAGLSTLAAIIGGGRTGARASLAALTGSLKGWHEGDKERADRAFDVWKAQTERLKQQWEVEKGSYQKWREAAGIPLEQKLRAIGLDADLAKNTQMAKNAAHANASEAYDAIVKQIQSVDSEWMKVLGLVEARARAKEHNETILAIKEMAIRNVKAMQDAMVSRYGPDELIMLGRDYVMNGKLPPGASRAGGQALQAAVIKAGIQWAKDNNIDPNNVPTLRADIAAAKTGLTKVRSQKLIAVASFGNMERHFNTLLDLSDKVPRTEVPAVNRAIVLGQRDFAGSPQAAAFVAQAYEVAMEYAKAMVGTAQGDEASRTEARNTIKAELTTAQLRSIRDTLVLNAKNRQAAWDAAEKTQFDIINLSGGEIRAKRPPEGLPEASAHNGKFAHDTATDKWYKSDGSTWTEVPGGR